MNTEVIDIEGHYQELLRCMKKTDIDFWGINIPNSKEEKLTYKVYQSQKISKNRMHPLVKYVEKKGMLRYFADVVDSNRPNAIRLDISLYQRNDFNIKELLAYLTEYVPFFSGQIMEVKKVAGMKITNKEDYHYASLYHIGLVEKNNIPKLLKFHFFTRWCENPNQHTKEGYRDDEFLEYLRSINIEEYQILAEKASVILKNCGGHLWMTGMDIFPDKIKYKITVTETIKSFFNVISQNIMDTSRLSFRQYATCL